MGCDTLVALGGATQDRVALFAKNSDRPPRECQHVVRLAAARYASGARARCQYLEIEQARETAAVVGTRPWWLWGLEQGVNEHRVAIGNETVFAREPLGATGLLGMDLVRLGLERARTASEAVDVITGLLERHGQGGSGHVHVDWPYHNAFLIADPHAAWIVETSDRHWVARRVTSVGNVSNGLAIGADWERGAADVTSFAVARGWWPAERGRVDFAAAYGDDTGVPPNICAERRRRAAELLSAGAPGLTAASMRMILRDHYEPGAPHRRLPFDDPHFFSLCMHADPVDNTTAALVARLPADPALPATIWTCLGSPCTGTFVPFYVEADVPEVLARGDAEPDATSPWWRMRELLTLVERDVERLAPLVRARWDVFESGLAREAARVEAEAMGMERGARAAVLGAFVEGAVGSYVDTMEALVRETAASA